MARTSADENPHSRPAVDLLVTGALLLTMEADQPVLPNGALAVQDGRLLAIGESAALQARFTAARVIDARNRVITPGLVNAHQHTTGDPLARGRLPDALDHPTALGLFRRLHLAETPADELLAAQLSCVEMLRYGTTAFLEAGTAWSWQAVAEAISQTGIVGVTGRRVSDTLHTPERYRRSTAAAVEALVECVEVLSAHPSDRVRPAVSLVGHTTASDELLVAASDLAKQRGLQLTMHLSPVASDVEGFLEWSGQRPVVHLAELGILGPRLTLVHMVHASDDEVRLLGRHGVNVVTCPGTAGRLGYGIALYGRHPEMRQAGATLALGADNISCGNTMDMLRIANLLAALYADARATPGLFGAATLLEMLTLGGARALGLQNEIGSLKVGKRADFVIWRTDGPEWQPHWDPTQALIYATDGRSVDRVIVGGRVIVQDGQVTTVDQARLYAEAPVAANELLARAGLWRRSDPQEEPAVARSSFRARQGCPA